MILLDWFNNWVEGCRLRGWVHERETRSHSIHLSYLRIKLYFSSLWWPLLQSVWPPSCHWVSERNRGGWRRCWRSPQRLRHCSRGPVHMGQRPVRPPGAQWQWGPVKAKAGEEAPGEGAWRRGSPGMLWGGLLLSLWSLKVTSIPCSRFFVVLELMVLASLMYK